MVRLTVKDVPAETVPRLVDEAAYVKAPPIQRVSGAVRGPRVVYETSTDSPA
jgi:hypothetical protein